MGIILCHIKDHLRPKTWNPLDFDFSSYHKLSFFQNVVILTHQICSSI